MNRVSVIVCSAMLLLAACEGGLSPADPAPVGHPAASPATSPGCTIAIPPKTSNFDNVPGGIWFGTLVSCGTGTTSTGYPSATAWVAEDGRFRVFGRDGHLLSGVLLMNGNRFSGHGLDFAARGGSYFSGGSTGLQLTGALTINHELVGQWTTEWGFHGSFVLSYDGLHHEASSLALLAATWQLSYEGSDRTGTWTVEQDGRFNGQDAAGCLHSGHFSLIDQNVNLYELELGVTGCELAGAYRGLAIVGFGTPGAPRPVHISVDDGSERALKFALTM